MATKRHNKEQTIHTLLKTTKNKYGQICRFEKEDVSTLYDMFKELAAKDRKQRLDRVQFRDVLHNKFDLTEDFLMDRVFRAFDRDNDGVLSAEEWVFGLSTFLNGDIDEKIKYCFLVYDLNGDGYISREEMFQLLKHTQVKQSIEEDPDEGVKELVEVALKKLDLDHDGRCSLDDFQEAVNNDDLLLESLGPCLPSDRTREKFLMLIKGDLKLTDDDYKKM